MAENKWRDSVTHAVRSAAALAAAAVAVAIVCTLLATIWTAIGGDDANQAGRAPSQSGGSATSPASPSTRASQGTTVSVTRGYLGRHRSGSYSSLAAGRSVVSLLPRRMRELVSDTAVVTRPAGK